jgi:NADPH:quinone reductase-like Zn-dependent oxidoreductase
MTYQRVIATRRGGPEVLEVVEEELPEPKKGEIRVRVLTAGVAFADILFREGIFPGGPKIPFTPGFDVVGVVEKLGEGVRNPPAGQTVAGLIMDGGYAEYVCVPASKLVTVPPRLDPVEVACLPLNYTTAYQLLHRAARIKSRERVLVHGAGGGIGTALLQLGRMERLEMYGTASRGKHELVSKLGAVPIDYRSENFIDRIRELTKDGVDAVFDPIGGTHWLDSYRTLRRGGRLVPFGASSIMTKGLFHAGMGFILLTLLKMIPDGKKALWLYGITAGPYSSAETCRNDLEILLDLLKQGKIKPVIAETFPLVQAEYAHEMLHRGDAAGKIILRCHEE